MPKLSSSPPALSPPTAVNASVDATPVAVARPDSTTMMAFVLAILLGGGNAVGVRLTVAELAPFWGAALRFGAAALIFWALVLVRRPALPRGRALAGVLLYGFFNFALSFALAYWALRTLTAGLGQVTLSLTPLLAFLLAVAHGKEQFRWRGILGALIAFAGIAITFLQQPASGVPLAPVFAMVGAAACFAEASVLVKFFPRTNPFATNAVAMTLGAGLLLIFALATNEQLALPMQASTRWALAYLILFGSVGLFYLRLFVVQRWTASAASYDLVFQPFVTVVVAAWLTKEPVTYTLLGGIVIAVTGVWVGAIARFGDRRPARP